ncbi:MAG: aminotransferase class V-fold PLP-dependent enzyme [Planctomycetota bacterium]
MNQPSDFLPPPESPPPPEFAEQFPVLGEMVFLNHAGVAPMSGPAADALREYARQASSSAYVDAGWYRRAHEVKALAARLIGAAGPHEIALIPNTSTGLSLVAKGLDWRPGDRAVITNVEYPANRYPWEDLKRFGVEVVEVAQRADGRIDAEEVCDAVNERTRVVSVSQVQYASGFCLDVSPIADAVHRVGGYLCVDAIQSCGVRPVDVEAAGIDFLSADGHKWMLGPEGLGFFYCRAERCAALHPNVVGWMNMVDAGNYGDYRFEFQADARRFEPGTWNVPGFLALGASLDLLLGVGSAGVWSRVEALTARLCAGLEDRGYTVFSPRERESERSGIVVFEPGPAGGGVDPRRVVFDLQQAGIVVALREGRLRASPHFYNTPQQMDRLVAALPG